jgi:NAD-dependent DNA ligase
MTARVRIPFAGDIFKGSARMCRTSKLSSLCLVDAQMRESMSAWVVCVVAGKRTGRKMHKQSKESQLMN